MSNTIEGGVTVINTLTQKNNGEFPIVMAESVSLADGTTVEDKFKTIVNYSHPNTPGYKHIPAGGSDGQILRYKADGEAQWGEDYSGEKYEIFTPATSTISGVNGLVPAPSNSDSNKFLRADATWAVPPDTNTTYEEATISNSGLMSSSDKIKLDNIEESANKYTHPSISGYQHIPSGGASGKILRWKADGEAQWGDDKDTVYSNATSTTSGLMSSIDKLKLDSIEENANNYTHPTGSGYNHIPSGGSSGQILRYKEDGEAQWGDDKDTTYEKVTSTKDGLMSSIDKIKLDSIEENANNYIHPEGSGYNHIPSGGTPGYILRYVSDGVAEWSKEADNTISYNTFTGATSSSDGTNGLVPAPKQGEETKFLRADATWAVPPDTNTTYSNASSTKDGLMSSTDKIKIDNIEENANNYTHPTMSGYEHIPSGGSDGQILRWKADGEAQWDSEIDTTYNVFTGSSISSDGQSGLVPLPLSKDHDKFLRADATWATPPDTNTTYEEVTSTTSGLMGSDDKIKLDGIEENANNYSHPLLSGYKHIPAGGSDGQILRYKADGEAQWGDDNDTTYEEATSTTSGLMNYIDKIKLDSIEENANNYTHPTGSGYNHIPSGGTPGYILRYVSDGVAEWSKEADNTISYNTFTGATSSSDGTNGLVPAPKQGEETKFLRADATWAVPPDTNTTYEEATVTKSGLMAYTDKIKLNSIAENANNYSHPTGSGYNHIPSGGLPGQILRYKADGDAEWDEEKDTTYSDATTSVSGLLSSSDKLKLDNIESEANKYTHPNTSGYIHIPSGGSENQILRWKADGEAQWGDDNDTTYSNASSTTSGLMASDDKIKLDGIEENANKYTHPEGSGYNHIPAGGSDGQILKWTSDGTAIWDDKETDTTYTFSSSHSSSNGESKISLLSNKSTTESVTIQGTGGSTVTTDSNGTINVNSITVIGSDTVPTDQLLGSIWIKTETAIE